MFARERSFANGGVCIFIEIHPMNFYYRTLVIVLLLQSIPICVKAQSQETRSLYQRKVQDLIINNLDNLKILEAIKEFERSGCNNILYGYDSLTRSDPQMFVKNRNINKPGLREWKGEGSWNVNLPKLDSTGSKGKCGLNLFIKDVTLSDNKYYVACILHNNGEWIAWLTFEFDDKGSLSDYDYSEGIR